MSFLNKNYEYVKHERFDEFLKSVGVPEDHIADGLKFTPGWKLVKDGDTYTYHTADSKGPKEIKFKSGVEHDDTVGPDNLPVKSTFTVNGNVVTQVITSDKGFATFKREYNGNDLVVSISADKWDGVAKRYYKAA